jgi:hypothetical protein
MANVIPRALVFLLLVLGTSVAALTPQAAHAHDRYAHQPATAHDQAVAGAHAGVLSQSCPAVPGRMCCCGSVAALAGSGKVSVVNCSSWHLAVALATAGVKFENSSILPPAARPLSQARPRAPPLSS